MEQVPVSPAELVEIQNDIRQQKGKEIRILIIDDIRVLVYAPEAMIDSSSIIKFLQIRWKEIMDDQRLQFYLPRSTTAADITTIIRKCIDSNCKHVVVQQVDRVTRGTKCLVGEYKATSTNETHLSTPLISGIVNIYQCFLLVSLIVSQVEDSATPQDNWQLILLYPLIAIHLVHEVMDDIPVITINANGHDFLIRAGVFLLALFATIVVVVKQSTMFDLITNYSGLVIIVRLDDVVAMLFFPTEKVVFYNTTEVDLMKPSKNRHVLHYCLCWGMFILFVIAKVVVVPMLPPFLLVPTELSFYLWPVS